MVQFTGILRKTCQNVSLLSVKQGNCTVFNHFELNIPSLS